MPNFQHVVALAQATEYLTQYRSMTGVNSEIATLAEQRLRDSLAIWTIDIPESRNDVNPNEIHHNIARAKRMVKRDIFFDNPSALAAIGRGEDASRNLSRSSTLPTAQWAQPPEDAPPPLPSGPVYHIAIDNRREGPFELSVLAHRAGSGELTLGTLVWCRGMKGWMPAADVPEVAALLDSELPPPLPG